MISDVFWRAAQKLNHDDEHGCCWAIGYESVPAQRYFAKLFKPKGLTNESYWWTYPIWGFSPDTEARQLALLFAYWMMLDIERNR